MGNNVKFVPRLNAPSATDKYWTSVSKGGLSICILISGSSVLPNCVGYAWGRFYEIIGSKPKLANLNAEDWYGNTSDGYKRSSTPQLGAIACWRKGKVHNPSDGCGHVAVVEKIESNGDIITSESDYGGVRFITRTYKKSNGYNSGSLVFQGFILPPVEFEVNGNVVSNTNTSNKVSADKIKVGDIVIFNGGEVYGSSSAANSTREVLEISKVKITIIALNAKHPYHAISQDGAGVYGWINEASIQSVNEKSVDEIAQEVITGKWGNGNERKQKLEAVGYDYEAIRKRVNELMKK